MPQPFNSGGGAKVEVDRVALHEPAPGARDDAAAVPSIPEPLRERLAPAVRTDQFDSGVEGEHSGGGTFHSVGEACEAVGAESSLLGALGGRQ